MLQLLEHCDYHLLNDCVCYNLGYGISRRNLVTCAEPGYFRLLDSLQKHALPGCRSALLGLRCGSLGSSISFNVLNDCFAREPALRPFQLFADATESVPRLVIAAKIAFRCVSHYLTLSTRRLPVKSIPLYHNGLHVSALASTNRVLQSALLTNSKKALDRISYCGTL